MSTLEDQLDDIIKRKDSEALISLLNESSDYDERILYALTMIDPNYLTRLTTISNKYKLIALFQRVIQIAIINLNAGFLDDFLKRYLYEYTGISRSIEDLDVYFEDGTIRLSPLNAAIISFDPSYTIRPDIPWDMFPKKEIAESSLDLVNVLLKHGADPNETDAFVLAIDCSEQEIVITLLNSGVDPNTPYEYMGTQFTYALRMIDSPTPKLIQTFLDHGADIHHPNALLVFGVAQQSSNYSVYDSSSIVDMLVAHGLTSYEIEEAYQAIDFGPIKDYIRGYYLPGEHLTKIP